MITTSISTGCAENEGSSISFEVCEDGLIVTIYSEEMSCELVNCIDSDKAKRILIALIGEL